jgi:hypothetical protein
MVKQEGFNSTLFRSPTARLDALRFATVKESKPARNIEASDDTSGAIEFLGQEIQCRRHWRV